MDPLPNPKAPAAPVNVRVQGSGKPTLLFVHGFGCDLTDWTAQIEDLSCEYRCMALDLPGHGLSARPAEAASIEALAKAVIAQKARALGDLVLVGHSMGCRVVVEAINSAPERVIGVVLIDGSVTVARGDMASAAGTETYLEKLLADIESAANSAELKARIGARLARLDRRFALELSLNAGRWATAKAAVAMAAIKVPVLVMQATYVDADRKRVSLVQGKVAAWADSVRTLLPDAELNVISNAGHFVMIEAARDTNAMLREFIVGLNQCTVN
jgi:pimeloyl-ACP methyl ester carboxylesterase